MKTPATPTPLSADEAARQCLWNALEQNKGHPFWNVKIKLHSDTEFHSRGGMFHRPGLVYGGRDAEFSLGDIFHIVLDNRYGFASVTSQPHHAYYDACFGEQLTQDKLTFDFRISSNRGEFFEEFLPRIESSIATQISELTAALKEVEARLPVISPELRQAVAERNTDFHAARRHGNLPKPWKLSKDLQREYDSIGEEAVHDLFNAVTDKEALDQLLAAQEFAKTLFSQLRTVSNYTKIGAAVHELHTAVENGLTRAAEGEADPASFRKEVLDGLWASLREPPATSQAVGPHTAAEEQRGGTRKTAARS